MTTNPRSTPLIPMADAQAILEPYAIRFVGCIERAFSRWSKLADTDPEARAPLRPRTRASFVHDHIVHEVEREFFTEPGFRRSRERGFLVVYIHEKILLRFKKLDSKGRSRNVLTKQQELFSRQLPLPGFAEGTRLTIGYQLDAAQVSIADIMAVCPSGRDNVWDFSVRDQAAALVAAEALRLSDHRPTPAEAQANTDMSIVKAKKDQA